MKMHKPNKRITKKYIYNTILYITMLIGEDLLGSASQVQEAVNNNNSLDVIMSGQIKGVQGVYDKMNSISGHAMTITFIDRLLFKYKVEFLVRELERIHKKTKGVLKYMYVSDISKNGRLHFHGTVEFQDVKYIVNLRRKLSKFGITKCKVIDDVPGWCHYCVKQYTEKGKEGVKLKLEDMKVFGNV